MTRSLLSQSFSASRLPAILLLAGVGTLSVVALSGSFSPNSLSPNSFSPHASAVRPQNAHSLPLRGGAHVALSGSLRQASPMITLKAGHTYKLSVDHMGRIVGAANANLAPGTTTTIPASGGTTGDSAPVGYWIIEAPDGTDYQGDAYSADAGWRARGNSATAITITVPGGALAGEYDAFVCITNKDYDPNPGSGPGPPSSDSRASGMTPEVLPAPPPGSKQSYGPDAVFNVT